jgi:hypothetical protein
MMVVALVRMCYWISLFYFMDALVRIVAFGGFIRAGWRWVSRGISIVTSCYHR